MVSTYTDTRPLFIPIYGIAEKTTKGLLHYAVYVEAEMLPPLPVQLT